MFKELYVLAVKAGPLNMAITADESAGRMTVVVIPKPGAGKDEPALATPLSLTATPEAFDEGFVPALTGYSAQRASLEEQVAATNEVLAAAKAASAQKGAGAVSKAAGARSPSKTATKPAPVGAARDDEGGDERDGDDDDAHGDGNDGAPAAAPVAASAGAETPNLFG